MGKTEGLIVMVIYFFQIPLGKFQGVIVMVSALPPLPNYIRHTFNTISYAGVSEYYMYRDNMPEVTINSENVKYTTC